MLLKIKEFINRILKSKTILKFTLIVIIAVTTMGGQMAFCKEEQQDGSNNVRIPTPKNIPHPRVFVNSSDIEGIKSRISSPYIQKSWEEMLKLSREEFSDKLDYNKDAKQLEALSCLYLLNKNNGSGRKAIEGLKYCIGKSLVSLQSNKDSYARSNNAGQLMVAGAITYDWCYDLLTDEDKSQIVKGLTSLASCLETGYPELKLGSLVGHGGGYPVQYYLLSAGIAIYDENEEMYDIAAKKIFEEFIPARMFTNTSGMHYQGNNYGQDRFEGEMLATYLFDKIGVPNIYGEGQKNIPYQWLYARRADNQLLRDGDTYINYTPGTRWTFLMSNFLAASYYKDPFIQEELMKDLDYWNTNPTYAGTGSKNIPDVFKVLFLDTNRERKPNSELPLTRFFGSPIGTMIARTSWTEGKDSDGVLASFKVGEYQFNNHMHLDAGNFQIYYKGALAIDSGVYEGVNGGYGSNHDINYNKRTIAHNSLLVFDPNEVFKYGSKLLSNDGGQRFPNNGAEPVNLDSLLSKDYQTGKVINFSTGTGKNGISYSYLSGDITQAYSSKLEKYERSFLFINNKDTKNPATIMVMDRVKASDEAFKKYFLIHSVQKPLVKDNEITILNTSNGDNGKLTNYVMLPEAADIETVGGEGHEFDVFGINYPNALKNKILNDNYEPGSWRVQISNKDNKKSDIILNAMQITDADTDVQFKPKLYSENGVVGVITKNAIWFTGTDEDLIQNEIKVNYRNDFNSTNQNKMLVFTGLEEGNWNVYLNNKILYSNIKVEKKSGTLSFTGGYGSYTVKKGSPFICDFLDFFKFLKIFLPFSK